MQFDGQYNKKSPQSCSPHPICNLHHTMASHCVLLQTDENLDICRTWSTLHRTLAGSTQIWYNLMRTKCWCSKCLVKCWDSRYWTWSVVGYWCIVQYCICSRNLITIHSDTCALWSTAEDLYKPFRLKFEGVHTVPGIKTNRTALKLNIFLRWLHCSLLKCNTVPNLGNKKEHTVL